MTVLPKVALLLTVACLSQVLGETQRLFPKPFLNVTNATVARIDCRPTGLPFQIEYVYTLEILDAKNVSLVIVSSKGPELRSELRARHPEARAVGRIDSIVWHKSFLTLVTPFSGEDVGEYRCSVQLTRRDKSSMATEILRLILDKNFADQPPQTKGDSSGFLAQSIIADHVILKWQPTVADNRGLAEASLQQTTMDWNGIATSPPITLCSIEPVSYSLSCDKSEFLLANLSVPRSTVSNFTLSLYNFNILSHSGTLSYKRYSCKVYYAGCFGDYVKYCSCDFFEETTMAPAVHSEMTERALTTLSLVSTTTLSPENNSTACDCERWPCHLGWGILVFTLFICAVLLFLFFPTCLMCKCLKCLSSKCSYFTRSGPTQSAQHQPMIPKLENAVTSASCSRLEREPVRTEIEYNRLKVEADLIVRLVRELDDDVCRVKDHQLQVDKSLDRQEKVAKDIDKIGTTLPGTQELKNDLQKLTKKREELATKRRSWLSADQLRVKVEEVNRRLTESIRRFSYDAEDCLGKLRSRITIEQPKTKQEDNIESQFSRFGHIATDFGSSASLLVHETSEIAKHTEISRKEATKVLDELHELGLEIETKMQSLIDEMRTKEMERAVLAMENEGIILKQDITRLVRETKMLVQDNEIKLKRAERILKTNRSFEEDISTQVQEINRLDEEVCELFKDGDLPYKTASRSHGDRGGEEVRLSQLETLQSKPSSGTTLKRKTEEVKGKFDGFREVATKIVEGVTKDVLELRVENDALTKHMQELQTNVNKEETDVYKCLDTLKELRNKFMLSSQRAHSGSSETTREDLRQAVQMLHEELQPARAVLITLGVQAGTLRKTLNTLRDKENRLWADYADGKTQNIHKLQSDIDRFDRKIAKLWKTVSAFREDKEKLSNQMTVGVVKNPLHVNVRQSDDKKCPD